MLSTFSIAACDREARQWGVAVQSKFLAAGAVVPFAQAEVGAVATQAHANTTYGPRGLALMAQGLIASEVIRQLTEADPERGARQVGMVDAQGRAAAFTGQQCFEWAGHSVGDGFCCQGNILAGPAVVSAMAQAFESTTGALAGRLVAALEAGQANGGDRRGQQSAGLLVVQAGGGYGGYNDRLIDLRVDEHPAPIAELRRILALQRLYFGKSRAEDLLPIQGALAREVQEIVRRAGYYNGPLTGDYDEATRSALTRLIHTENLEEREQRDERIDRVALEFLRARFGG
ncbi:MAG: DUF1028 domain-containing protein [Chloroflexi bacterium]|nr:DUF1028 domain-containing protein [Chloroflexota bacterium]MBI3734390.1 DUF1028 domain-containing protein [Chloroflexota bacterium]